MSRQCGICEGFMIWLVTVKTMTLRGSRANGFVFDNGVFVNFFHLEQKEQSVHGSLPQSVIV